MHTQLTEIANRAWQNEIKYMEKTLRFELQLLCEMLMDDVENMVVTKQQSCTQNHSFSFLHTDVRFFYDVTPCNPQHVFTATVSMLGKRNLPTCVIFSVLNEMRLMFPMLNIKPYDCTYGKHRQIIITLPIQVSESMTESSMDISNASSLP